jgi:lysophospholipase L1-like esterase
MLDCLILGDSIAVGTHNVRPECVAYAKVGINSWQWNNTYSSVDLSAGVVIISLGSNDHKYIHTEHELTKIRDRVKGKHVYWILPHGNNPKSEVPIEDIQATVERIAKLHGDTVLPITHVQKDNIHPTVAGYKEIGDNAK